MKATDYQVLPNDIILITNILLTILEVPFNSQVYNIVTHKGTFKAPTKQTENIPSAWFQIKVASKDFGD